MKKTFLVALGLCAAATAVLAQGAAITPPKVAVIDMARISAESQLGKGYATRIEALEKEISTEGTRKQGELQKMDSAIKTLQDELEKQASVLSPEAADKKRQDIVRKQRERQAFLEDGQAELQRMKERAEAQAQAMNAEFQQKIKPAIDAVAKEKGIDIILFGQVALTMNPTYDISQEVIAKSDEVNRAAAARPASPAPAAAPAAPAAPAPSPSPRP